MWQPWLTAIVTKIACRGWEGNETWRCLLPCKAVDLDHAILEVAWRSDDVFGASLLNERVFRRAASPSCHAASAK